MGRRSIVLLLTLAVLLQPAFASVCMMKCPPQGAARSVPMAGYAAHAHHHHVMSTASDDALMIAANGMCDKTVDLRSSALVPTVSPAVMTSDIVILEVPSEAMTSHSRVVDRADRATAPIVVPLRI